MSAYSNLIRPGNREYFNERQSGYTPKAIWGRLGWVKFALTCAYLGAFLDILKFAFVINEMSGFDMSRKQTWFNLGALMCAMSMQLFYNYGRLSWPRGSMRILGSLLATGSLIFSILSATYKAPKMEPGRMALEVSTALIFVCSFLSVFILEPWQSSKHNQTAVRSEAERVE